VMWWRSWLRGLRVLKPIKLLIPSLVNKLRRVKC
jgi:hypothetical protein